VNFLKSTAACAEENERELSFIKNTFRLNGFLKEKNGYKNKESERSMSINKKFGIIAAAIAIISYGLGVVSAFKSMKECKKDSEEKKLDKESEETVAELEKDDEDEETFCDNSFGFNFNDFDFDSEIDASEFFETSAFDSKKETNEVKENVSVSRFEKKSFEENAECEIEHTEKSKIENKKVADEKADTVSQEEVSTKSKEQELDFFDEDVDYSFLDLCVKDKK